MATRSQTDRALARRFLIGVLIVAVLVTVLLIALFWRSLWWPEQPPRDVGGYSILLPVPPAPAAPA